MFERRTCCLFLVQIFASVVCSEDTLQQVHIVFRHGDRWPVNLYPTDPNEGIVWPDGPGQLTNVGIQQQYELGTFLRERYQNVLTGDPREVLARSSDKDRCIASTQVNLAAFHKPSGRWIWNDHFDWHPVPIHTVPGKDDGLLNEDAYCPEGDAASEKAKTDEIGQAYTHKYQNLFVVVSNYSGMTIDDPMSALDVYGTLFIEKLKGLKIPDWVTDSLWKELEAAANDAFIARFSSSKVRRLRAGPLISEIVARMQKKAGGESSSSDPKIFEYSTHDAIVSAVLSAMGVFNNVTVPYCATILTELHKVNGVDVVRLYYRNDTAAPLHPLTVPSCDTDCPLDQFVEKMTYVTIKYPDQWKEECGIGSSSIQACGYTGNSGWSAQLRGIHNQALLLAPLFYKAIS